MWVQKGGVGETPAAVQGDSAHIHLCVRYRLSVTGTDLMLKDVHAHHLPSLSFTLTGHHPPFLFAPSTARVLVAHFRAFMSCTRTRVLTPLLFTHTRLGFLCGFVFVGIVIIFFIFSVHPSCSCMAHLLSFFFVSVPFSSLSPFLLCHRGWVAVVATAGKGTRR